MKRHMFVPKQKIRLELKRRGHVWRLLLLLLLLLFQNLSHKIKLKHLVPVSRGIWTRQGCCAVIGAEGTLLRTNRPSFKDQTIPSVHIIFLQWRNGSPRTWERSQERCPPHTHTSGFFPRPCPSLGPRCRSLTYHDTWRSDLVGRWNDSFGRRQQRNRPIRGSAVEVKRLTSGFQLQQNICWSYTWSAACC